MNFNFEPLIDNIPSGTSVAEAVRSETSIFVGEKKSGILVSSIYLERENPLISDELTEALHDSVLFGLELCQRIDPRSPTSYIVQVVQRCEGYMTTDGRVDSRFTGDNPVARSAAVLHEGIHCLQEDTGLIGWNDNPEALPNLAEFLFTSGSSRLGYFQGMYEKSFDEQTKDPYYLAMKSIRQVLHDESDKPSDDGYRAMRQKIKAMNQDQKIEMISKVFSSLVE